MAIYVDRDGIDNCISKIQQAIENLQNAASQIDSTMGELPTYWQGDSHDSAQATYDEEYKTLLTKTVPENVDSFKQFINTCKQAIVDTDNQLSGR